MRGQLREVAPAMHLREDLAQHGDVGRIDSATLGRLQVAFAAGLAASTDAVSHVFTIVCDTARTFGRWVCEKLVLNPARPSLVRLGPPIPDLAADLWLLTHPDLRRSPRVRAFVDHVVPALLGKRHLLEGSDNVPR